ncbi:hypothetical protein KI387_002551, partial [Taxus chinensis]
GENVETLRREGRKRNKILDRQAATETLKKGMLGRAASSAGTPQTVQRCAAAAPA